VLNKHKSFLEIESLKINKSTQIDNALLQTGWSDSGIQPRLAKNSCPKKRKE